MKGNRLLLLAWFSGISGFFLVFATIFITMYPRTDKQILFAIYESNSLVYWAETFLLVFVLGVTIWILYNYMSGKGFLEMDRKHLV